MLLRNFVLHSYGCGRLCLLLEFDGATCAFFLPPSLAFPTMVKILTVRDTSMAHLEFVRLLRRVMH